MQDGMQHLESVKYLIIFHSCFLLIIYSFLTVIIICLNPEGFGNTIVKQTKTSITKEPQLKKKRCHPSVIWG